MHWPLAAIIVVVLLLLPPGEECLLPLLSVLLLLLLAILVLSVLLAQGCGASLGPPPLAPWATAVVSEMNCHCPMMMPLGTVNMKPKSTRDNKGTGSNGNKAT